ncbi:MAG: hypothetical protein JNL01_15475 [Bdellovibrionales bacterium]|nr:hypothetical protein [Bdellovibrionales bacterium]
MSAKTRSSSLRWTLFTAFAIFHGIVIAVAPNPETPLGGWLKPIMKPYLNAFEFGSFWNFFSPNPGQAMYVEWELLDKNGGRVGRGMMPEFESPFLFRERQNRRMTSARYIGMAKERPSSTLGPYLCRQEKQAHAIRFWASIYPWVTIEEAASGSKKVKDLENLDRREISVHICPLAQDEQGQKK